MKYDRTCTVCCDLVDVAVQYVTICDFMKKEYDGSLIQL